MKQYIDLCNRIIEHGHWVTNKRTGKRCLTVINADFEYDCSEGHLPILTTKKAYWKQAIAEMLGYLRGYTSAADFRAIGCKTWDANSNENKAWLNNPYRKGVDDMGRAYRFRSSGYYLKGISMVAPYPDVQVIPYDNNVEQLDFSSNKHELVGSTHSSNNFGNFVVIKEYESGTGKELVFDIQFSLTKFVKQKIRKSEILRGEVKDLYYPSVCGIAARGAATGEDVAIVNMLSIVWVNMIGRCYEESGKRKTWYKDKGVFVDSSWLIFENFVKDFKKIPNWHLKLLFPEEYSLDKDCTNSNYYSVQTCRWSTKIEQSINTSSTRAFAAKNIKSGETEFGKGAIAFTEKKGVSTELPNIMGTKREGDVFEFGGWEFEMLDPSYVTYIEVDQFKSIYAYLKLGIDDRNLIMTAYQPHSKDQSCLNSCMHTHTFSILDGTLYLTSYQRSDDIPLGHGFNQIQVAWLLMIMAKITGLKPGKAFHKIVNAHIYEDQLDTLISEQLGREPYPSPVLRINPLINTLEDLETWVTVDDFKLIGYQHHPAIKYAFSV